MLSKVTRVWVGVTELLRKRELCRLRTELADWFTGMWVHGTSCGWVHGTRWEKIDSGKKKFVKLKHI